MKRIVLSALLLAAAVATTAVPASAEVYGYDSNGKAYVGPNRGQAYSCTYTNYSGSADQGGISYWTLVTYQLDGKPMPRGTEHFEATNRYGEPFLEGYKATWAKPVVLPDPYSDTYYTQWEYTFNPYGPQCKKAKVFFGGFRLTFSECGDGHSRICELVY